MPSCNKLFGICCLLQLPIAQRVRPSRSKECQNNPDKMQHQVQSHVAADFSFASHHIDLVLRTYGTHVQLECSAEGKLRMYPGARAVDVPP